LVPGETAAPGTASGKTGSPSAQIASTSFGVTVSAVDPFWNLVNTATDTVGLSSSDATATLPPATTLTAGTTNLTASFNTNGSFTLGNNTVIGGSVYAQGSATIAQGVVKANVWAKNAVGLSSGIQVMGDGTSSTSSKSTTRP